MKNWPLLLTVGVVLYLAFLLARLPAAVIAGWLPDTVTLYGTSGTLWNGKAQAAMVGNVVVHELSWDFVTTQLLRLRLAVEFDARLQSGFLRGRVGTRSKRTLRPVLRLRCSLPQIAQRPNMGCVRSYNEANQHRMGPV